MFHMPTADQQHQDVRRIKYLVFQGDLVMSKVLERAHVGRSTWGRMKAGKSFQTGTAQKLETAIRALLEERSSGGTK